MLVSELHHTGSSTVEPQRVVMIMLFFLQGHMGVGVIQLHGLEVRVGDKYTGAMARSLSFLMSFTEPIVNVV